MSVFMKFGQNNANLYAKPFFILFIIFSAFINLIWRWNGCSIKIYVKRFFFKLIVPIL